MSKRKADKQSNTALCYIRQSFTRNENDMESPERQRANIVAYCERMGWTPEFYEDAEKHKTGTKEKNRPGWLALKARLGDPDVVALVANDLARLHRKGWRVGDLIDYLDERSVTLVLAAPGREVDLSTPMGRLFVQFTAILDEWYAADISQRAKDNIAHRKAQGKGVGMPPFGTMRGKDGYLKPSRAGAWLLTNGTFVAGKANHNPEEGATWHGYYETAKYILALYATGEYGLETIAYKLNNEGWAFRDRTGKPRTIWRDDVRRVVANWAEYGGITVDRKAKDRPAYEKYNVEEIPFRRDRAVFEIELLRKVAQVRQERSQRPVDKGEIQKSYPYPLAGITFCAHCEALAQKHNNPKLRSRLGGKGGAVAYEKLRYRHKQGVQCGSQNRSVPADVYEHSFKRLISLLTVKPDMIDLMTELAIQAERKGKEGHGEHDLEKQKQEAIALCRRRIDAAIHLYKDGDMEREEYLRVRQQNEREIAHWEARTTETEKLALELGMCIEAVGKLERLWNISDDEDRKGLVRSLFEYLVFDLDKQQIVEFRLKAWADRFITLRAVTLDDDNSSGGGNAEGSGSLNSGKDVANNPLWGKSVYRS